MKNISRITLTTIIAIFSAIFGISRFVVGAHSFFADNSPVSVVDLFLTVVLIGGWLYNRMSLSEEKKEREKMGEDIEMKLNADIKDRVEEIYAQVTKEYTRLMHEKQELIGANNSFMKEAIERIEGTINTINAAILELASKIH